MDKHNAPSFQFYPKDFLSDPDVAQMNMAQKGAYIVLLSYQWLNDGLPKSTSYIRNLLGNTPKWKSLWEGIEHKFVEIDGKLYNKRLYKEKQKQIDHRKTASKAGKKGAKKRWQTDSHPIVSPMAKNNSSSSTPSSTATSNTYQQYKKEVRDDIKDILYDAHEVETDITQLEELYRLIIDNQNELKRWEKRGKTFTQPVLHSLMKYLHDVGDFETAKLYAMERNRRRSQGDKVVKMENFCTKDWIEYAPPDESDDPFSKFANGSDQP